MQSIGDWKHNCYLLKPEITPVLHTSFLPFQLLASPLTLFPWSFLALESCASHWLSLKGFSAQDSSHPAPPRPATGAPFPVHRGNYSFGGWPPKFCTPCGSQHPPWPHVCPTLFFFFSSHFLSGPDASVLSEHLLEEAIQVLTTVSNPV